MVLPFTPRTTAAMLNNSAAFPADLDPICYGVYSYEKSRPPGSTWYFGISWAMIAIACVMLIVGTFFLYRLREEVRFKGVRPFSLMVVLQLSIMSCLLGSMVSITGPEIPCWFTAVFWIVGMSSVSAAFLARIIALYIESEYARAAAATQSRLAAEAGTSDTKSSHSDHTEVSEMVSLVRVMAKLTGLVFIPKRRGVKDASLTLPELSRVRRSFVMMYVAALLPSCIGTAVLLAIIPPLRVCKGCDVFMEVWLTLFFFFAFGAIYLFPAVLNVRKKLIVWGSLAEEVSNLTTYDGFIVTVSLVLIIVDPGNTAFNRIFPYQWILWIGQVLCFVFILDWHIVRTYFPLTRAGEDVSVPAMSATLQSDEEVTAEFTKFVTSHFMAESMNFYRDMSALKKYWYERNETWRASRVQGLINTYLTVGAVQELNISETMRQRVRKAHQTMKQSDREVLSALEAVLAEIENLLAHGPWIEFCRMRQKNAQTAIVSPNGLVSGLV